MRRITESTIRSLRESVGKNPADISLRIHLAEVLLSAERFSEAEEEFRKVLRTDEHNQEAKLGLAEAFLGGGKEGEAEVILESLMGAGDEVGTEAVLLYSRLLFATDRIREARDAYLRAVELDPGVGDEDFADLLEIDDALLRVGVGDDLDDADLAQVEMEKPDIGFSNVGGMDSLKEEIRLKIIYPLTRPELYAAYGKKAGGGILMYGPPGCGKTHLARAVAGEIGTPFFSVGINEVLDMWMGQSEQNLHELFETARGNSPCVLFFDEVDALASSRSDMKRSAGRSMINQFLAELDGIQSDNSGLLILAATNAPWHMDAAFRRPGRFDRVIFVPPPDEDGRAEILKILLREKPTEGIDERALAKKTKHFSGADLRAVVEAALEEKLSEALKRGVALPITMREMKKAAGKIKPVAKEWFSTARNYAMFSNQSGTYDDVLEYLKKK